MAKLKVALIGAGLQGENHIKALREEERAEVVGIADKILPKAERLAAQVGARPYHDAAEMLKREEVDVAIIATPDPLHKEPFLVCAEAGVRAIVCEKPLATSLGDAEEMMEAAEKRGIMVFTHFENRFAKADMATKLIIREGLIGEPVYAEMALDDNISVPTMLWGERSREWASRSSPAYFLMSHTIDLVRWYFEPAEVKEVFAVKNESILGYAVDLYDALLIMSSGAKVRLKSEWVRQMDDLVEFRIYICGSEGGVFYNKRGGYKTSPGWKANLSPSIDFDRVRSVQRRLGEHGVKVSASISPNWSRMGEGWRASLEIG
ncbi:hypothetical protein DRP77_05725, partial [Candidatus Poribacteria bacterium]